MSYSVAEVRRWDASALGGAGEEVRGRSMVAGDVRRTLADGTAVLDDGWDGLAANAVIEAAEGEKRHVSHLADGLEDLADALVRAQAALVPAVQSVRDRIADAEAAGLIIAGDTVRPATTSAGGAGAGTEPDQAIVDLHAAQIGGAVETVCSLDEHYGREIDQIASQLNASIPAVVDRSPIPGSDDPWPGRGVDAMTGAASLGYPAFADELDPETRGKHKLNPAPDDFGRAASKGLRYLGKAAGTLGVGVTVYDGVKAGVEGESAAGEATAETIGALGGGWAGGAAAGAAAGTFFGPVGTLIGAGVGAAVGSYLGQKAADKAYEEIFDE